MKQNVIENKKIALTSLPCPWYNSILSNPCLELSSYFFITSLTLWKVLSVVQTVKRLLAMRETQVGFLGWEDLPGEGNGNPLWYSCLENPMDGGAWQATVHGVAKSQTQWATSLSFFLLYESTFYVCFI